MKALLPYEARQDTLLAILLDVRGHEAGWQKIENREQVTGNKRVEATGHSPATGFAGLNNL
ncbi:MAG TPA: hypothetical protein VI685_06895 [Candidatus Angelobacter sp.]